VVFIHSYGLLEQPKLRGIFPFFNAKQVCSGERLKAPPGTPLALHQAMQQCWLASPTQRPTFRELSERLHSLCMAFDDPASEVILGRKVTVCSALAIGAISLALLT
jgi:hypothetical protein